MAQKLGKRKERVGNPPVSTLIIPVLKTSNVPDTRHEIFLFSAHGCLHLQITKQRPIEVKKFA